MSVTWKDRRGEFGTNELGALVPVEGARREFRTCDECVWRLRTILGFPDAHLYYPTAELDRAIASALDLLERYGERFRYRQGSSGPRIELEPLGRPATNEDVRRGLAVFSLEGEGERRVVEGLKLPVQVHWTKTIRGVSLGPPSVWQAEEISQGGKRLRYYGLIAKGYLGAVPAAEIEILESSSPKRRAPREMQGGVPMRFVDRVVKGEFKGKTFQFHLHSPSQSGLEVGKKCVVGAKRTDKGTTADTLQWLEKPKE